MTSSSVMRPGAIALVTGATSGIGAAIAEDLISAGLKVICLGRRESKLQELFAGHEAQAHCLVIDVTDPEFANKLSTGLPDGWGEIDVLVASAGSDVGGRRPFTDGEVDDWTRTIDVNVNGVVRSCHAVLPGMLERGRGHVVTIGSVAGLYTYPGGSIYAPSKHAVHAFADSLRQDYTKEPVRITEILPGMVKTGFAEARHKGDTVTAEAFYDSYPAYLSAEDISAAVMFALNQPDHINIAQIVVTPTGFK